MTDLLTPEVVKRWLQTNESLRGGPWFNAIIDDLGRSYLALWDHNKDLVDALAGMQRVVSIQETLRHD